MYIVVENLPFVSGYRVPSKICFPVGFVTLNLRPSKGTILFVLAIIVAVSPGMYDSLSVAILSWLSSPSSIKIISSPTVNCVDASASPYSTTT